jgi:hypothetical protein
MNYVIMLKDCWMELARVCLVSWVSDIRITWNLFCHLYGIALKTGTNKIVFLCNFVTSIKLAPSKKFARSIMVLMPSLKIHHLKISMLLRPRHALSCYLRTSFFDMNGVENAKYLAFSYVLETSILYIRPTMMVHDTFNLPPKTHSCENWKRNVMEESRTLS